MSLFVRSVMAALALACLLSPTFAGTLVPHRVAYDLALENSSQISDVGVDMKGRMVYEFTGNACEGFTVNFRFVLETRDGEDNTAVTDLRTTNFESGDGRNFQFLSQTFTNQVQTEEIKGSAVRDDTGVKVKLKLTDEREFTITKPVIFPSTQLLRTLAEAGKGTTVFSDDIYDGSDGGEHIFHTSTVIGQARTNPPDANEQPIGNLKRWPVTVSYFGAAAGDDQPPDYSISFDLWENGVSSKMRLDYGDFVLKGDIVHFELLPETPCVAQPLATAPPVPIEAAPTPPAESTAPAATTAPTAAPTVAPSSPPDTGQATPVTPETAGPDTTKTN